MVNPAASENRLRRFWHNRKAKNRRRDAFLKSRGERRKDGPYKPDPPPAEHSVAEQLTDFREEVNELTDAVSFEEDTEAQIAFVTGEWGSYLEFRTAQDAAELEGRLVAA